MLIEEGLEFIVDHPCDPFSMAPCMYRYTMAHGLLRDPGRRHAFN